MEFLSQSIADSTFAAAGDEDRFWCHFLAMISSYKQIIKFKIRVGGAGHRQIDIEQYTEKNAVKWRIYNTSHHFIRKLTKVSSALPSNVCGLTFNIYGRKVSLAIHLAFACRKCLQRCDLFWLNNNYLFVVYRRFLMSNASQGKMPRFCGVACSLRL
jgi:hypothetical protein